MNSTGEFDLYLLMCHFCVRSYLVVPFSFINSEVKLVRLDDDTKRYS